MLQIADAQISRLLSLISKQLPVCTSLVPLAKDSTASTSSSQAPAKDLAKHLLHVLCQVSNEQLHRYFGQFDFSCKRPAGTAALQLLGLLLPHLQLPHPLNSLTASSLAFQVTARVLRHVTTQQQAWQQAWHFAGKGSSAVDVTNGDDEQVPDSQASRDNHTPTGRAAASSAAAVSKLAAAQTQQQLLVHLHECAAQLWCGRLHLAGELGNVAMCRFSLQLQQSAHEGLQQLHIYCSRAGITPQMQQQLQQLLVKGSAPALVLKEGLEAAAAAALQQNSKAAARKVAYPSTEQQQGSAPAQHPLLQNFKQLLGAVKAAQQLAAGIGSSGGDAAALLQVAADVAVSGVQAWGLAAQQLGPLMLEKSVGQPLLTVRGKRNLVMISNCCCCCCCVCVVVVRCYMQQCVVCLVYCTYTGQCACLKPNCWCCFGCCCASTCSWLLGFCSGQLSRERLARVQLTVCFVSSNSLRLRRGAWQRSSWGP
jgi:hypothetical protein